MQVKVDLAPGMLAHWVNELEVHERSSEAPITFEQLLIVSCTVDAALHLFLVHGRKTPLKQVEKVCATQPEFDKAKIARLTRRLPFSIIRPQAFRRWWKSRENWRQERAVCFEEP